MEVKPNSNLAPSTQSISLKKVKASKRVDCKKGFLPLYCYSDADLQVNGRLKAAIDSDKETGNKLNLGNCFLP